VLESVPASASRILLVDPKIRDAVQSALEGAIGIVSLADWLDAYRRLTGEPMSQAESVAEPLAESQFGGTARHSAVGVLLAHDHAAGGELTGVVDLLHELGVPTLEFDPRRDSEARLQTWLCSNLLALVERAETSAAHAHKANARLRADLMALQDGFSAFDSVFYQLGAPAFSRVLAIPAGTQEVSAPEPPAGSEGDGSQPTRDFFVEQVLPVSQRGVGGVELFVTRLPRRSGSSLTIALGDAPHGPAIEALWSDLVAGWNRFVFPRAIDGDRVEAKLSVRTTLVGTDTAGFGLGPPVPLRRFRLSTNGTSPPDSTLAIRVWRGIPGASVPSFERAAPIRGRRSAERLLMPSECPAPELLSVPDGREDFVRAEYWGKENAILVHGTVQGPVTALLRNIPVKSLTGVSAIVQAGHASSPELAFRVGAWPSGTDHGDLANDSAPLWTALPPQQWGETHASLDQPYTGALDLSLTVRAINASASNWAWGLFRGFRLYSDEG
jgi:hypothetical protein